MIRREPLSVRGLVVILVAGLLLSSAGCGSAEQKAGESASSVWEGMSKDQVRSRLGEADRVFNSSEGEIWHYSYGAGSNAGECALAVFEVIFALAIVGAIVAAMVYGRDIPTNFLDGHPSTSSGSSRSTGKQQAHFQITFNPVGTVIGVSGIAGGP